MTSQDLDRSDMNCLKRLIQEQFKSQIHLSIFKDFSQQETGFFKPTEQNPYLTFTAQPNVVDDTRAFDAIIVVAPV